MDGPFASATDALGEAAIVAREYDRLNGNTADLSIYLVSPMHVVTKLKPAEMLSQLNLYLIKGQDHIGRSDYADYVVAAADVTGVLRLCNGGLKAGRTPIHIGTDVLGGRPRIISPSNQAN